MGQGISVAMNACTARDGGNALENALSAEVRNKRVRAIKDKRRASDSKATGEEAGIKDAKFPASPRTPRTPRTHDEKDPGKEAQVDLVAQQGKKEASAVAKEKAWKMAEKAWKMAPSNQPNSELEPAKNTSEANLPTKGDAQEADSQSAPLESKARAPSNQPNSELEPAKNTSEANLSTKGDAQEADSQSAMLDAKDQAPSNQPNRELEPGKNTSEANLPTNRSLVANTADLEVPLLASQTGLSDEKQEKQVARKPRFGIVAGLLLLIATVVCLRVATVITPASFTKILTPDQVPATTAAPMMDHVCTKKQQQRQEHKCSHP